MTEDQVLAYTNMGFEIGLHPMSSRGTASWCDVWGSDIADKYQSQLAELHIKYPGLPVQASERNHCYAWYGYAGEPEVDALPTIGIRMNVNKTYYPAGYVNGNYAGYFAGTAMPMRFTTGNGTLIDVYDAPTLLTDDNGGGGTWLPGAIASMLDWAIGPQGNYAAFVINMHSDNYSGWAYGGSDTIVAAAQARSVPVVSGRQMVQWLDGRNGSSFGGFTYNGSTLGFTITTASGARGLLAMLPTTNGSFPLSAIRFAGNPIAYTTETIKGVEYALFNAAAGSYQAFYEPDLTPPVISNLLALPAMDGTATISWITNEPASSRVDYGTSPTALTIPVENLSPVTSHALTLTGLTPRTTYFYRVTSTDPYANTAVSPDPPADPAQFHTPQAAFINTTVADFSAGSPGSGIFIDQRANGKVTLRPAVSTQFSGSALPSDWSWSPYGCAGTAVVHDGILSVDCAHANPNAYYDPGHALEARVTFKNDTYQHFGYGTNYSQGPWAIFSTYNTTTSIYARTNVSTDLTDDELTLIPGITPGTPHDYRVDWQADHVEYYVDGNLVATHNWSGSLQMRPVIGESYLNGLTLDTDWLMMGPYASSGTF